MEMVNQNGNVFSFGDLFLNPQMSMDTVWKRVSDCTLPVWKRGCVHPRFHMGIPIWKRGDVSFDSHMETENHRFPMGRGATDKNVILSNGLKIDSELSNMLS
jgi:hypothetical protein